MSGRGGEGRGSSPLMKKNCLSKKIICNVTIDRNVHLLNISAEYIRQHCISQTHLTGSWMTQKCPGGTTTKGKGPFTNT